MEEWRILPREPEPLGPSELKGKEDATEGIIAPLAGCSGCAAFILAAVIAEIWVVFNTVVGSLLLLALLWSLGFGTLYWWLVKAKQPDRLRNQRERVRALGLKRLKRAEDEAQMTTDKAILQRESVENTFGQVLRQLSAAQEHLVKADSEFNERAYSPFWDSIERSARCLAECVLTAQELPKELSSYYGLLEGRFHNFSHLPNYIEALPDPTSTIAEFERLVRMAQKDFEFAVIWEHRRTREAIMVGFGFATLGEAVGGISSIAEHAMSDLRSKLADASPQNLAEHANSGASFEEAAQRWDKLKKTLPA